MAGILLEEEITSPMAGILLTGPSTTVQVPPHTNVSRSSIAMLVVPFTYLVPAGKINPIPLRIALKVARVASEHTDLLAKTSPDTRRNSTGADMR